MSMRSSFADPADLIVAPATVPGDGARAIVRLSGEGLARLLGELLVPEMAGAFDMPGPARCVTARLGGELAPVWGPLAVEVLWWPGPAGPTGGPLAELQLPASTPLVDAIVAAACRHGARLARGGEFSLRSFLAGRLDLVQAEAVVGVVDARTPEELAASLDRMAGGAGRRLNAVREEMLDLLADVEAAIDFSDERSPDHVATATEEFWRGVDGRLGDATADLEQVEVQLAGRDTAGSDVPRVVVVGRPNIGKSSLFNALAGSVAAIVADESGTTRDWIGVRLEGEGTACMLIDLAGIDPTAPVGSVAAAATAVALAEVARADLLLVCRDAADAAEAPSVPPSIPRIEVITRCDLAADGFSFNGGIATSIHDPPGIASLRKTLLQAVARMPARGSTATLRMRVGVAAARAAITAAMQAVGAGRRDEAVVAGYVGRAVHALGEITGREMSAELLDRIFQRHCIGK